MFAMQRRLLASFQQALMHKSTSRGENEEIQLNGSSLSLCGENSLEISTSSALLDSADLKMPNRVQIPLRSLSQIPLRSLSDLLGLACDSESIYPADQRCHFRLFHICWRSWGSGRCSDPPQSASFIIFISRFDGVSPGQTDDEEASVRLCLG